jgi:integrase
MPRQCKPLTATEVKNLPAKSTVYRAFDGQGMYIEVHPSGSMYWRMKYQLHKSEKRISLGKYPEVSLAQARKLREEARALVAAGKDPVQTRRVEKARSAALAGDTFEKVAREWFKVYSKRIVESTAIRTLNMLETDIFPVIGNRPVCEIITPELLFVIRKVESRGAVETAHRIAQRCNAIFRFAAQTGISDNNPAANLAGALQPIRRQHYKYLKEADLPEFFRKLDTNEADLSLLTVAAIRLLTLTFVRTTELIAAKWSEFDFEKKLWLIDPERMKVKGRGAHKVPLSKQAIKVLEDLRCISGNREYVFPNANSPLRAMSNNTILFALYRMGYHSRATGHGFRATASTILNEHDFPRDHIERQLAHGEEDKIRAAYNHAEHLKERTHMMQWYADHLDSLGGRGKVIDFPVPLAA